MESWLLSRQFACSSLTRIPLYALALLALSLTFANPAVSLDEPDQNKLYEKQHGTSSRLQAPTKHAFIRKAGDRDNTQTPQILFIDSAVPEMHALLRGIDSSVEVILIDDRRDGLEQIGEALRDRSDIATVHIISHGESGRLLLGASVIDRFALADNTSALTTIGNALTDDGDIRLYGCRVAAGVEGRAFVRDLALRTQADVAASTNLTGPQALDGDWVLEAVTDEIATHDLWRGAPQGYRHTLASSQNFDGEALGQSGSATATYGDFTFSANGSANIGIVNNGSIVSGTDHGLRFDSDFVNDVDTDRFYTTDGSEFALDSFEIDGGYGDYEITITGKQDGSSVNTANLDLNLSSSSDGGASYVKGDFTASGTISFTGWDYIDEIVFTITTTPTYLDLDIDEITVSAAVPPNASPTIAIDDSTLGYTENDAVTQIAPAATLNDSDGDADWDGGTLEVQITANSEAADEISIPDNIVGTINTDGTNLLDGATTIGTLSASQGTVTNNSKLTVTFNANATNALVQQVLRAIHYRNTSNDPATSNRTVTFTGTDKNSASAGDTRTISVTATNDNPVITSNGGGDYAATSVNENTTAVTTVTASDPDSADTHTFSITGGADETLFNINNSTGALTFASAPNYDSPSDSDANNVYDVQVTVTDSGTDNLTDTQDIAVTVNNVNENPVITSDGGGDSASVNAAENQTAVTTVIAMDQDSADTLTYSLSDGADMAQFIINSSTGALTFAAAANYESPTDSDANGVYDVQVTVTDNGAGNLTDAQNIAVTVTNVNENPVITSNGGGDSAATSVNENTTAVSTVTASDPDSGDTHTFSITGGADETLFSINNSTGALTFASAPNYESPSDSGANNVYDVRVTVIDSGDLTDVQDIAVTVTNLNEAPSISGTPATTAGSGMLFSFVASASDPDAGTTLTYSINTTPAWATFNMTTGELSGTPTDGDVGKTTSNIVISVSDGSLSASLTAFSLTVIEGNQPPTIGGIPETSVLGHTAYSFIPTASDADSDPLTFSITNKPTWASFDSQTGKLSGTPSNSDQGTTTGIVISVSDGTASASLSFDLSVTENLDIDGDGMPNDWELANGLDPNDPNDADSDLDGDGLSNLDEYLASTNPNLDDNPPLVTPPADITVNAVGLFTPVNVGTANAYDTLDGVLTPTSDAADYYRPGSHAITWSATDAAGNTGTAMQTVNVIPLVSFSKDQTTSEGATVSFKVILNGPAVNYPVSVPYVVAGSAALDGSDHALSDGIASIASGLETKVSFTTVDDGPGEGTEQVVIAMDRPSNAVEGSQAVHTILLLEGNVPPRVELSADQGWGPTHTLVVGEGPVIVSSMVTDPNTGDVHSYDWSATDAALVDNDTAVDTYTFDPALLTPGLYTLRLSVDDASSSDSSTLSLNLIYAEPILSATQDSDGDTIDDASEGIGDSDNDGVANYLDALDSANVLQEQSAVSDSYLIETEPGVRLRLGTVALQHANGEASVDLEDIANFGGVAADSSYSYPSGLFDFAMEEVPAAGQSVQVVIPLLAPIPQNPVYRKVASGIWRNFVVDAANILASASGEPGYCPPPNDSDYTSGLTPGHWCVQLTIEDGGPNDADGRANHAIEDPGGVAQRLSTPFSVTSRGGGGGSAMLFLLALIVLALRRLRTTRKGVAK